MASREEPGIETWRTAVREARERLGWTYERMADELGLKSSFSAWYLANGIKGWPPPPVFRSVCERMGLDETALLRSAGYLDEVTS